MASVLGVALGRDRYATVAIWFHWITAALVLANLWIGLLGPRTLMPLHKSFGLTVLALTAARIVWRLMHRRPAMPAWITGWQRWLASGVHAAFYVVLVILPFSGWAMSSAGTRPVPFFGLAAPKLPVSQQFGDFAHESHELLGWVMLALVVAHVAGAMKHQFVDRRDYLSRMGLPHRG